MSQIGTVTGFVVERGTLVCVYVIDFFIISVRKKERVCSELI